MLPFKYAGANAELTALADGLSEEIVTGLSRFSYLRVIARSSTLRYADSASDVRAIGKEIGARYVMEGSIRQAGAQLRVAVQLIDAATGAHLWAETYRRSFQPDTIFDLQGDLVPRIVSTGADFYGVLPHSMSEALRGRRPEESTPLEAAVRAAGYYERISPEEHAEIRASLEHAVEKAPDHAAAWALLSLSYQDEYRIGCNLRPDPLGRALAAARRAVEIAPSNHIAHEAFASVMFFRRDLHAFRRAADRVMALNPMDPATVAYMGLLLAYAGDWEQGCAIVERSGSRLSTTLTESVTMPNLNWWNTSWRVSARLAWRLELEICNPLANPRQTVANYARFNAFSETNRLRARKAAGLSTRSTARNDAKSEANQGRRNDRDSSKAHAGGRRLNFHASHSAVAAR